MTDKEFELVQYLRMQDAPDSNVVLIEKDILEESLTFFTENKIKVLAIVAMNIMDDKLHKVEGTALDLSEGKYSIDEIIKISNDMAKGITHFELLLGLKK